MFGRCFIGQDLRKISNSGPKSSFVLSENHINITEGTHQRRNLAFLQQTCSKVIFLKNTTTPGGNVPKEEKGLVLYCNIYIYMYIFITYGTIKVAFGPFELKLGQVEATKVERVIYTSFDSIWSNI